MREMPIYEYRCAACSHRFERLLSGGVEISKLACPSCGLDARRMLSLIAVPMGRAAASPQPAEGAGCGADACCGGAGACGPLN